MQDGIFHSVGCLRSTRARAPASESSSSQGIPRRRGHLLAGGDRAAVTMSTRSAEPRVVPPRQRWATRDLVVWQGRVGRRGGEVEPSLRGVDRPGLACYRSRTLPGRAWPHPLRQVPPCALAALLFSYGPRGSMGAGELATTGSWAQPHSEGGPASRASTKRARTDRARSLSIILRSSGTLWVREGG